MIVLQGNLEVTAIIYLSVDVVVLFIRPIHSYYILVYITICISYKCCH